MEKFTSTEWWLSVVIVGVAVNLLSVALQRTFGRLRVLVSKRYRESKSREADERRELISRLESDREFMATFRSRVASRKLTVIQFMLSGVFFLLLGIQLSGSKHGVFQLLSGIAFTAGNITWLLALSLDTKATKESLMIRDAEK